MSIRLSKACKDLNVAMTTAVNFLAQNGVYVSIDPNLKLVDEIYLLLANEFNKDIAIKIETDRLNVERVSKGEYQHINNDTGIKKHETNIDNEILINEITNSNFEYSIDKSSVIMENKTPLDIIQSTENAPLFLNELGQQFNSIESQFNSVLTNLNQEKVEIEKDFDSKVQEIYNKKTTIENNTENILSARLNENKKKLQVEEEEWSNGNYVFNAVSNIKNNWILKRQILDVSKWSFILLGILDIFDIFKSFNWLVSLIDYYYSLNVIWLIVISAAGYFILNAFSNSFKEKISAVNDLCRANSQCPESNRVKLRLISDKIRVAIESGSKKKSDEMVRYKDTLQSDYNEFKSTENSKRDIILTEQEHKSNAQKEDFENKLKEYEKKYQQVMSDLRDKTSNDIQSLKSTLDSFISLLNRIPESFDSNTLKWNSDSIYKGKELVSTNFRLGFEKLTITIENNQHSIDIPICIPFLNKSNLVFNCNNQQETKEAIRISHNIIARTLLSLPASKTKITFIDPLELGGNAAPFTPLLREIYGGMVFTQPNDIENQLSTLTRAIENVIQKYLQDKFKDIAEYNFKTKEVPEPYRLLVVYNFPHGFNDTTASKLLNIIKSGPKAGIHTILVNDKNAKLPYGMDWKVFEGVNIKEISLVNQNTINRLFDFDKNLSYIEIVDYINKEFPNTNSIKVLFKLPPQTEWWKDKAHKRFSVPIGRHAVEEQSFTFNNDDDNQALLIGKPGSGKSNLLHAIITNSLWKYSPDQLEIYLIDFKGGVEFTIYADKQIPHIKTIAIESEREFGLSVLDGVERELLRREMEFSKTGVQNIEQYHEKFPDVKMPRVLLIVDEFQEFFAEDDNIKQAVDDKFDRIVRKGRAFGINSLFSSQTLSGNSIKKSTKELIDIRIALMCSDLDSSQILDDRNPAARDLTRPGEGIYNSENGKVEGNRRFQTFFMETADLIKTIESVVEFANSNGNAYKDFNQIIFRGSEKAMMEKNNHPLNKIIASSSPKSLRLWIGEPIAIADDVTAIIRKQGGSNLIVAGHDEGIGLRVMCSSIISIAVQQQPNTCKFYSFNFYNVDSEFVNTPNELFKEIQQEFIKVGNKQVKETLESFKLEIERRLSESQNDSPNIYLCFFSLQRGRSLRKDGYSMSDEGNLLAYILKEGADVGVYSLVQVDTMDNFSKNLDDNLLKEFSQRIASQMNPDNSVKLIGNQKASKLGSNRAWYFDDNENTMIKFKPYELPTFSWIAQLQKSQSTLS